jgi:ribosomal protein S18 acetylase RimI-like enzyme
VKRHRIVRVRYQAITGAKVHHCMNIRPTQPSDVRAIAAIILPVFRDGSTYTIDPDISEANALTYWLAPDKDTFVAEDQGAIVGTYYLRANQDGGGRHVCNCGYVTKTGATGRGIARAMCLHSLDHARSRGYRAMQFNFVVATNERAVRLWQSLGFEIVGRLPNAFRHPTNGFVDALVMYQTL